MKISKVTRRDIVDAIRVESVNWNGRLNEIEFLERLLELSSLPSTDPNFPDAEGDIWQHRVNNDDWDNDWVFTDSRFNFLNGDDEACLRFLCETMHPEVRPDTTEAEHLCQMYNRHLKNDDFQLVENTRISGKPTFVGRFVGVGMPLGISAVQEISPRRDSEYLKRQIRRLEIGVRNDSDLAIGTAKELVETCCKTILKERGVDVPQNINLSQLVKRTSKELVPDIPEKAKAANTIKTLLNNLASIAQGLAELRNQYGTGHGKEAAIKGLTSRHARLAVGVAP